MIPKLNRPCASGILNTQLAMRMEAWWCECLWFQSFFVGVKKEIKKNTGVYSSIFDNIKLNKESVICKWSKIGVWCTFSHFLQVYILPIFPFSFLLQRLFSGYYFCFCHKIVPQNSTRIIWWQNGMPPPKAHPLEYGGRGEQAKGSCQHREANITSIDIVKINEWSSILMIWTSILEKMSAQIRCV